MDSTANAASNRVYQDFDPSTEWVREPLADTLMVYLPGFRKEQMKVQVTSANNLKISGTRQLNDNIWSRFRKEIPIPSNYDTNGISAKFEKGILYVRNPKLIVPESPAPPEFSKPTSDQSTKPSSKPPQETPKPAKEEPPKTSSKPEKITNEESSKAEAPKPERKPKPTKQEPAPKPERKAKPTKQEPENPPKEEPSAPLEARKSQKPQETPKPTKEQPSKPTTEEEKKEEVVRPKKVTNEAATSEQDNAGKIEKAEALAEVNESGSCKFVMENYKNSFSGLMKEMKNARNATNIVLAILFGVVLGLYIKNAFRSFMKSTEN